MLAEDCATSKLLIYLTFLKRLLKTCEKFCCDSQAFFDLPKSFVSPEKGKPKVFLCWFCKRQHKKKQFHGPTNANTSILRSFSQIMLRCLIAAIFILLIFARFSSICNARKTVKTVALWNSMAWEAWEKSRRTESLNYSFLTSGKWIAAFKEGLRKNCVSNFHIFFQDYEI